MITIKLNNNIMTVTINELVALSDSKQNIIILGVEEE